MNEQNPEWWIYQGENIENSDNTPSLHLAKLGLPPPWRRFDPSGQHNRGILFEPAENEKMRVNTALLLRRPLLVTGKPGTGKTSLTYAVAHELGLEPVLRWSVTSHTTLKDGLYRYDAIGRLQDSQRKGMQGGDDATDIGKYLTLGPLGTAFFPRKCTLNGQSVLLPRILLIDEIDKSDIDLPNDLLHLFEEGEFEIPELARLELPETEDFKIKPHDYGDKVSFQYHQKLDIPADGRVRCECFPLVVMTSNGEREFPPAFMRRCLQLKMQLPDKKKLESIVERHFRQHERYNTQQENITMNEINRLIDEFLKRRDPSDDSPAHDLAADQLLNAIYLTLEHIDPQHPLDDSILDALWQPLSETQGI